MLRTSIHEDVVCVEIVLNRQGRESSVYVYLTDGMLVDTGPQNVLSELISFYEQNTFESVVLTHSHEDHVGTASWIEQNLEVSVYIHPYGMTICSEQAAYPLYRQVAWGVREPFNAKPLTDTFHSRSTSWKVIYTPGHADDHVVLLHEETGRLLCGDLYLTAKPKVLLSFESIPQQMASLRIVLDYSFDSIYCGHAGYIASGKNMLRQKLDYLENLSGEIIHLHQRGWSAAEINDRLFEPNHLLTKVSDGEFDTMHIVTSVLRGLAPKEG
ncbi:MBL fold metallo-hydrolase [Brevibacillus sp. AY1]|uniref:MBL fold metallo-hydrolase n=1 Tax=Brevibacillus sp. AY1 TaxID=2807621 RepID=UPI0024573317|nr:MBL fold metallo-hydrolase [Brevibacillus sp. AY1]MDH4619200.1 MBL fold metallo-hydrolase [Brevibacillus sp. AY1]